MNRSESSRLLVLLMEIRVPDAYFFTLMEAANAIAVELCPDAKPRLGYSIHAKEDVGPKNAGAQVADVYWHHIYDALCDGELVGRDPISRHPIAADKPGRILALAACAVSLDDLNIWLAGLGVGVQVNSTNLATEGSSVDAVQEEDTKTGNPASDKPTSTQLADALGPFLQNGQDSASLKAMLGDVRRRPRLANFRGMVPVGRREIAVWEVGGVVLYLIKEQYLTLQDAREALEKHYPNQLHAIDHISIPSDSAPAASWIPAGI